MTDIPIGKRARPRLLPLLAFVVLGAQSAAAHEYDALIRARKYEQAERAVDAKLAVERDNADALVAKTDIILAQAPDSRLDEAATLAERCIAAHPQHSECHEALGNVLGTKALRGGVMSALGYAGKIRDAFVKAIELDPDNLDARFALLQYYLQAPAIVGGGAGKAKALVADTARRNADAARLLQAAVDVDDEQYAKAEAAALAVTAATPALAGIQLDVLAGVATGYAFARKFADSERLFRDIMRRFPDEPAGPYGVGRILQERGKPDEAITLFNKALALHPFAHIHYHIGQCWQTLGDKARAIAAFEKALSLRPALARQLQSDAQDRLQALRR